MDHRLEFMEDAAGRSIWYGDTVALESSSRAFVVIANSRTAATLKVQLVGDAMVEANPGELTVVDRSYLRPGIVVASASDPAGQLGVITATATAVDVAARGGVSPAELRRVAELKVGDFVVSPSGRWIGRVVEAVHDVDVRFDDGGRCRVTDAGRKLRPVVTRKFYSTSRFWPGQRVSSKFFRAARWLGGSYWKPSYLEGTVTMAEVAGALVYWLASPRPGSPAPPPAYHRNLDDLRFLYVPAVNYWTVGDRCFFRSNNNLADDLTKSDHARKHHQRQKPMRRRLRRTRERMTVELEQPALVTDTSTTADVLWQDGTRQRGVPSASLRPYAPKNAHDFFPGELVGRVLAAAIGDDAQSGGPAVGVVRSLDCKDQTVRVSWLKEGDNDEVDYDETVSAYQLTRILDHDVFYGKIVVRLDAAADTSTEQEPPLPASDLSWVGRIIDFCDGKVQVQWGDGNTTEVLPHEIAVVKEVRYSQMARQMGDWVYDDGGDDEAQGETNQAEVPTANTGNNGGGENNTIDGPATTRIIARVCSAIIRLGSKVVEQGKRFRVSGWATIEAPSNAAASENVEPASSVVGNAEEISTSAAESLNGEGEGKAEADTTGDVEAFRFPQFDVVQSPPDHRFLDNIAQDTIGGRMWTKRVQREWKILENDLPGSIYVRAFEDRMDLLRAVMVGVSGTPYQDGLFFFDLQLPPSYPESPPLVNYRSLGLRLNPNLYPSGTVCLSLLGTFGGQGAELWSPDSSTVLQVLVSIQGLVLTAQPYYNEAGFAAQLGTPMGQRNELPYSENTYLLTLQTMLHLLRRPPMGFQAFVRDHFRRRGPHVLRACQAYREGCLVGTLDDDANATEAAMARPCSAGFRLALANIVPRLTVELAQIGAHGCQPPI